MKVLGSNDGSYFYLVEPKLTGGENTIFKITFI